MILKRFLIDNGAKIKSKVIIMEGSKEVYNNYLDKVRVYTYLESAELKSIYASDNDIVIEI